MKTVSLKPEYYTPVPPERKDYGIGIIGCGSIVKKDHLPAYHNFGYRVVAACDLVEDHLVEVQNKYGVPHITREIGDILRDEEVQIIDLAVHAKQRLPIIEQICRERPAHLQGILSQKPFAMSWDEAVRMVDLCSKSDLTLMVNQQARWAPPHKALKYLIHQGIFGHIYCVTHFFRSFQDIPGSWFVALENFNIVDHGIHFIDLCRFFTGLDPIRVKATATNQPGQAAVSPMCHTILMEFPPEAEVMAVSYFNNIVRAPRLHCYQWYIDGTEASAMASMEELAVSLREQPDRWQLFRLRGSWNPDAFGGSMGELMSALSEGREPETSGRDNLNSIKIAYAAVESAAGGQAVEL